MTFTLILLGLLIFWLGWLAGRIDTKLEQDMLAEADRLPKERETLLHAWVEGVEGLETL